MHRSMDPRRPTDAHRSPKGRWPTDASTLHVRPLNVPRPLHVALSPSGLPERVRGRTGFVQVERVLATWEIDDEWWRSPISRVYASLLLSGGRVITVYLDQITGTWFLHMTG
jgi:hypothetical protein